MHVTQDHGAPRRSYKRALFFSLEAKKLSSKFYMSLAMRPCEAYAVTADGEYGKQRFQIKYSNN